MGKHEKKGERVVLRRDGHQGTHTHTISWMALDG